MPKEALRYLQNAKDLLGQSPIEDDTYLDRKPVREAMGTAYLAVLEAINESLLKKGLTKRELPQSVESVRQALRKHLTARNGTLLREFEKLYDALHIAGYYRGLIYYANMLKDALRSARVVIH